MILFVWYLDQVLRALEPHRATRVLRLSNALGAFAGWVSNLDANRSSLEASIQPHALFACCCTGEQPKGGSAVQHDDGILFAWRLLVLHVAHTRGGPGPLPTTTFAQIATAVMISRASSGVCSSSRVPVTLYGCMSMSMSMSSISWSYGIHRIIVV